MRAKTQAANISSSRGPNTHRRDSKPYLASQNLNQPTTDTLADYVAIIDLNGIIEFANLAFPSAESGQIIGSSYYDLLSTKEALAMQDCLDKVSRTAHPGHFTCTISINGQEPTTFEVCVVPVFDAETVTGYIVSSYDVANNNDSKRQLRQSEKRYRSLYEDSPLPLITLDMSKVKSYIDNLKEQGVKDFFQFFHVNPHQIHICLPLIDVLEINTATLEMFRAVSDREFYRNISNMLTKSTVRCLVDMISTFAHGAFVYEAEVTNKDFYKNRIYSLARFSMSPGIERTWEKVQVSVVDITKRVFAERQLSTYQQQLRLLASQLSLTEERQRRKIAAGLHDNVCQSLALSTMKLQMLRQSIEPKDHESIDGVCSTIMEAISGIRNMIFDLSSPVLYRFGLKAALVELASKQFKDMPNLSCRVTSDDREFEMEEDVAVLLFQSVRELLVNIIKHANASNVIIDIKKHPTNLSIIVTDDGDGFEVKKNKPTMDSSGGFGLFNIYERLEHIGGALKISSKPKNGSQFTLITPLDIKVEAKREANYESESLTGR
jgi:signal transduction histidine kinase